MHFTQATLNGILSLCFATAASTAKCATVPTSLGVYLVMTNGTSAPTLALIPPG
jgi:hypothetical protein